MTFHRTLRFRIVGASAILSALIVIAVSIYVIQDAESRALDLLDERVATQAELAAGTSDLSSDPLHFANHTASISGGRVTVLDSNRIILADSHDLSLEGVDYSRRPEIISDDVTHRLNDPTLATEVSVAVRPSIVPGGSRFYVRLAIPTTDAIDTVSGLRSVAALGGIIVIAGSIVFATLLSGRLTRSIGTVTLGARQVASGDLTHRLRPEPPQEVEQLANAVNEMAAQLSGLLALESQERNRFQSILESMSDGVIVVDADGAVDLANPAALEMLEPRDDFAVGQPLYALNRNYELNQLASATMDSGERHEAEIEFLDSRRFVEAIAVPLPEITDIPGRRSMMILRDTTEARRLDTTRREFVSNASHELRTPLTAIKASVETLQAGALDNPEVAQEFLGRMATDTDRMNDLITEMLELSRIESGAEPLDIVNRSVREMVQTAISQVTPQAIHSGIEIDDTGVDDVFHSIDALSLTEAITNLLTNALKASTDGAKVTVAAWKESDGALTVSVRDEGPGIDAEHLPHIFERFYKGDTSRASSGSGLGLAIVRHIVEAHGGTVLVASQLGEGAEFRISLPGTPLSK
ncbi:MAG: HAMP domain-containing protein [Chloroflexi bacterium]|nr:HAMP domain-containing protein [Chloroflexota bacterium]